jgi:hypothetical protein
MKKILAVAALSVAALGLTTNRASAWFHCCGLHHCCGACATLCVKPYNAFSPVCCGTICCDGCLPLSCGQQGGMCGGQMGYGPMCGGPMCGGPMCGGLEGGCCDSCGSLGTLPAPGATPTPPPPAGGSTSFPPAPTPLPTGPATSQVMPRAMPMGPIQATSYRPGYGYGYGMGYGYGYGPQAQATMVPAGAANAWMPMMPAGYGNGFGDYSQAGQAPYYWGTGR